MIQNIRPMQPMQSRQNFGQLRMENTRVTETAIRVACEIDSSLPRTLQRVERDQANVNSMHIILDGDNNGSLLIKVKEAATGVIHNIRDYMKHDAIARLNWDVADDSDKLSIVSKHILKHEKTNTRVSLIDSELDSDYFDDSSF